MKKFGALRFVASLYRVLAWIVLVGGILFSLATMVMGATGTRALVSSIGARRGAVGIVEAIIIGLLIMLGALLCFLTLNATSDGIHVALSIEENTRDMATYLKGATNAPGATTWDRPPTDE